MPKNETHLGFFQVEFPMFRFARQAEHFARPPSSATVPSNVDSVVALPLQVDSGHGCFAGESDGAPSEAEVWASGVPDNWDFPSNT